MDSRSIKVLQISDLHLDRSMLGGRLKLPFDKAQHRQRELREALIRAVDFARSEKVDLVLIAGDLWEEDNLATDTATFVADTLGKADVPVIIAPGNHDFYSPGSHYSDDILAARFDRRWPENVYIFRDYDFSHYTPPGLPDVSITGLAYRSNQPISMRRLGEHIEPPEAALRIAVIHGSRDDHLPSGKMSTLPFSDKELLAQPFDYTALGHYHSRAVIQDDAGKVKGSYSGSACALSVGDTGVKGCLILEIKSGGVDEKSMEFIELDERRLHRIRIDVSGLQHTQAVENKIRETLEKEEVRSQDMALVELTGSYIMGSRIAFDSEFIQNACYHLHIDTSNVRPEWSLEDDQSLTPRTTEAIFRARLKKMIDEAAERGDQAEVVRLQNAFIYGMDALHGNPVLPRQVE